MTIVFFGSSEFSISALKACLDSSHEVVLVVSTPDQKQGRGLKLQPTPVSAFCAKESIPFITPDSLKDQAAIKKIEDLKPDLFVVSSYGKLIPNAWLAIPRKYSLNVHPSLLPKWRGAAPIQWTLLSGDSETGVSIAEVTKDLDAGDIFFQERFPVPPDFDSEALTHHLAGRSYHAVLEVLKQADKGLKRTPQDSPKSTYARKLTKEDGLIRWTDPAETISNKVRALRSWPTAYFIFNDEQVQVLKAEATDQNAGPAARVLSIHKDTLEIACQKGSLKILKLRPAGKKEMSGADFANGKRLKAGANLS